MKRNIQVVFLIMLLYVLVSALLVKIKIQRVPLPVSLNQKSALHLHQTQCRRIGCGFDLTYLFFQILGHFHISHFKHVAMNLV